MTAKMNEKIGEAVRRERRGLLSFIRRRVPNEAEAEDILQDVFYQLTVAERMLQPVEQVTSWLFTVARNKIIDRYRKKKPDTFTDLAPPGDEDGDAQLSLSDLLPDPGSGPEGEYLRTMIWEELEVALSELPDSQREVFEQHELEGKSFKEISEASGVSVNTLLSRKRYAVLHLRERLRGLYQELLEFDDF